MALEIVGAGMAGLLAANMLRHRDPFITEIQPTLPNNHSAVLRFRTHAVGDVLNIPFRCVTMTKTALPWKNPVADALAYSYKNTGVFRSDRSIIAGLVVEDRYIAPTDLIRRMANSSIKINYGTEFIPPAPVVGEWKPIISTLPMPVLMGLLKYPVRTPFYNIEGLNIRAIIVSGCDAFVSVLVPDPNLPMSRISITGDELIIEVPRFNFAGLDGTANPHGDELLMQIAEANIKTACELLGMDDLSFLAGSIQPYRQKYSKVLPIDDDVRKDFIHWATDTHGIFSLGRFATWRPGLLLDDLVKDIRLIDKWISNKDRYAVARHR